MVADITRMYRAVLLAEPDKDLHRFLWRSDPKAPLGVSSSSFLANMCVKQNALDHSTRYPNAAKVVMNSFYVDGCLTGFDSIQGAIELQRELHALFAEGKFLLRK